ncbi:glutamate racemase [Patescibacteria group bacterium]
MIGVFDSGAGGLSVVRALKAKFPDLALLYFGDTARVPYGNKSPELIKQYTGEAIEFLIKQGASTIIIACHTASAVAAGDIRKQFDIPIFDVAKPGVEKAIAEAKEKVGVIGTSTTTKSQVHAKMIKKQRKDLEIINKACPLFVPLVEEQWLDSPVTRNIAEIYLEPLRKAGIDTLILACTHYPWLRNVIQATMGEDVRLVDPAEELAENLAQDIDKYEMDSKKDRFFASDATPTLEQLARTFLANPPQIEIVKLT